MSTLSQEKRLKWENTIRLQRESGLNTLRWCREQQIKYKTFLYWKNRIGLTTAGIQRSFFTELADASDKTGITIEYQQIRIHLTKNFDPSVLMKCLRTVKAAKC